MRSECNVPIRNFIDNTNSGQIAENCSKLSVFWTFGFCLIVTLILIGIHLGQRKQGHRHSGGEENHHHKGLHLPIWMILAPGIYFIWFLYFSQHNVSETLQTEKILFAESGMKKSEFINFRAGEDRARLSSLVAAAGAIFIGSTALFGPFLRADR